EVWSNLLKTVASSRLVPTKDVIILGDPHSGKSTLIELLKTALPTPTPDALANGVDGSKTANGVPSGPNGKNDLALSYSFWDVEDDENEDTVARLGLYQIAGSHKSYHALLKYCLNTKTIADTVVLIVLDWSKPWAFVETLERWIKVLDTAIKQILQEGAVATAAWTKGKAVMEELQEKLSRFLQEYTEPQPHGTSTFSELGSTDAQSVLLPLTEGCLTNNTGVPIAIVCTKSDNINILEREMDYKEESFDYIQQTLRTICLKYGASLFYTSIHHPHTFADLRQYILHRLLTPSTLNNAQQQQQQQQQPSSFPFKLRAQVVERDQVMVPSGWDSIGKIKVLRSGFDCEGVAAGWDDDLREGAPAEGVPQANGVRKVYEETIRNPRLTHAPVTIQPIIVTEDDQTFLDRHFETLQKANERPSLSNSGHGSQPP
ncbi:MAG: dynein light intermediate chain-domain-containing protein, partial [Benniella sp.]